MYRSLLIVVGVYKCIDFIVMCVYFGNLCYEFGSLIVFKISYIIVLRVFFVLDCNKIYLI